MAKDVNPNIPVGKPTLADKEKLDRSGYTRTMEQGGTRHYLNDMGKVVASKKGDDPVCLRDEQGFIAKLPTVRATRTSYFEMIVTSLLF